MPLELVTIPCRTDNYAYLLHSPETGETTVIDVPEAEPILVELRQRGWTLSEIWLTHHHQDHIEGAPTLQSQTGAKIAGAQADARRLPPLDYPLSEGISHRFAGQDVHILDVPGHTVGHIVFYLPDENIAGTGDSLMALGCGRVSEGTMDQMWTSLSKIMALPPETIICSGHEYSETNARFALTIEPNNPDLQNRCQDITAKRAQGQFTVPTLLALECKTNPFLRAGEPTVKTALGMENESDGDVFAEIRHRKDRF